jgi:hypothetical protein
MADCTLSDGREITIDLMMVTIEEWRDIWNPFRTDEAGDKSVSKISGLSLKEVKALPVPDYKRITDTAMKKFRTPITDDPKN